LSRPGDQNEKKSLSIRGIQVQAHPKTATANTITVEAIKQRTKDRLAMAPDKPRNAIFLMQRGKNVLGRK
jgi:hypothetical protein